MRPLDIPPAIVRDAVERALIEDIAPLGDLTSNLLDPDLMAEAHFGARADGVLAGEACADEAFRQIDGTVQLEWSSVDGDPLEAGQSFGTVRGRLVSILTAERTALNFLGHLSGIATHVRSFVDAAAGRARIWDTRKTTPGLRTLEKAAVRAGGGFNHRGNLSDWLMFKDNHLTGMSITDAVARSRAEWPGRTVHVECDRFEQVVEALDAGADLLLLDNMTPNELRACVAEADSRPGGRPALLEASGGITIDTVADYAGTGVDMISSGSLTNSAPVLDIGLDIHPAS